MLKCALVENSVWLDQKKSGQFSLKSPSVKNKVFNLGTSQQVVFYVFEDCFEYPPMSPGRCEGENL